MAQVPNQGIIKSVLKSIHRIILGWNSMIEELKKSPIRKYFNIKRKERYVVCFTEEMLCNPNPRKVK